MSFKRGAKTLAGSLGDGYFVPCSESSLKVGFGNKGPWTPESSRCCRWNRPDSIRRRGFDRAILPAYPLAGRALAACPIPSAKQPLPHQRISEGSALPADSELGANRNHRAVALQRRVSLLGRPPGVSRSHQLAPLPRTVRSFGTPCLSAMARPLADSHARTSGPSHLRSRQHGVDGLWPS